MLFMGQEFFSSSPFLFFADHKPDLQPVVRKGREKFLSQFPKFRHAIEQKDTGCQTANGHFNFRN